MLEFNELIKEIGNELNIKVTLLSDNWLTILEKDNQIHYIQGYKFDLNNHGIGNIIDDKGLFYDLLTYKKMPIISHTVIFSDYKKNFVLDYFNSHNKRIIVKGNIGTCGKEVFLVTNENDLFKVIDTLFLKEFSISLCPYYDIVNEYRVIVLDNKVRCLYGKMRPIITGDGIHTIKELLIDFNKDYYSKEENQKEEYNEILPLGEKRVINYQFNLSNGAVIFDDIDSSLKEELSSMALKVSQELNIVFASVDIIKTTDNKLLIMEANSGVMMNNYRHLKDDGDKIVRDIYRDAIKLMFKE